MIFSITSKGKFAVLYRFMGGFSCCDGAIPQAHMLLAKDGMFYGTTSAGGEFRDIDHQAGFGTVFRFNSGTNAVTILHSFNIKTEAHLSQRSTNPGEGRVFLRHDTGDRKWRPGGGTLFKIDTNGNLSLVAPLVGMEPRSGVIQAKDGSFYGTNDGGSTGSLYRVDTAGNVTVLNRFDGADGRGPRYQLTQASDKQFYGSAVEGGLLDNQTGDIFRLTTKGELRVLHSFASNKPDGILPNAQLVEGHDGVCMVPLGLAATATAGRSIGLILQIWGRSIRYPSIRMSLSRVRTQRARFRFLILHPPEGCS